MDKQQSRGTILFAGGGTSGHINPALAIADALKVKCPNLDIKFCGLKTGLEAEVVPNRGYDFLPIAAAAFPYRPGLKLIKALKKYYQGVKQAEALIQKYNPLAVVGTGGYVCAPLVSAAHKAKIPVLLHEQNAYPGRSNRFLAFKADKICLGFAEAAARFPKIIQRRLGKLIPVGNPVHAQFKDLAALKVNADFKSQLKIKLGLNPDQTVILISGGSLGAKKLNDVALEFVRHNDLSEHNTVVILATGTRQYANVEAEVAKYHPEGLIFKPYLYDMPTYLAAADLIISRAGAVTCAEIAALGQPVIYIPYPYAASDHQTYNAKAFSKVQAAKIFTEELWTAEKMQAEINSYWQNPKLWQDMGLKALGLAQYDAAARVAVELLELIESV